MPKQKIHFRGFLTNTDSSILNVTLKHGFKIEVLSLGDAVEFVKSVENTSFLHAGTILTADYPCNNSKESKVYFVSNSFDVDISYDNISIQNPDFQKIQEFRKKLQEFHQKIQEFHPKYIDGYLKPVIRLMRLYKEGNIDMPFEYFFFYKKNKIPMQIMGLKSGTYISRISILNFENSEIKELEQFIHNTKLPFKKEPLQLAFESFELSHHIATLGIPFLLLMMSMESLFNPSGQGELTFRVSRNTAVLIGKNEVDSQSIWEKMKELYDTRSKIVHTGKSNLISEEDVLILRDYVRRSIREFYKIGKSKPEILKMLNSSGFGDKHWLQKETDAKKIDD